jgi:hypothetical protein
MMKEEGGKRETTSVARSFEEAEKTADSILKMMGEKP